MSLTLEEVRRVRFRMARRGVTGYDVADVDNFIDKVEESFGQFENERDLLRREAQSAGGQGDAAPSADPQELAAKDSEIANLRAEVERLNAATLQQPADNAQVEQLNGQNEQLRAELARVRAELDDLRTQRVSEISGQAEHITVGTREEASPAVIRLVQLATEQAEQLVEEAEQETQRKLADAKQQAHEITTDARTKAERIESEARVNAEQLRREAEENAARVNTEADARRVELFADLEREQGELTGKVASLREFEGSYRENLRSLLTRNLGALDQERPEPADIPELAQRQDSETPRLDALAHGSDQ
ncbi:DivIVA domain-containing protein [Tessaracoccus terricola]